MSDSGYILAGEIERHINSRGGPQLKNGFWSKVLTLVNEYRRVVEENNALRQPDE